MAKTAKSKFAGVEFEQSSGNVFEDLGRANAPELQFKGRLARRVLTEIESRGLTQAQSAKLLGVAQPHISDLKRYKLERFSAERLMEFLVKLDNRVEVVIRENARPRARTVIALAI